MHRTFETPGRVLLLVENEVGVVDIVCRDGDTTEVTLDAETPEAAELVAGAVVECTTAGDLHSVRVKIPRRDRWMRSHLDSVAVHVAVPTHADLDVGTASAGIRVRGTARDAFLRSASGSIVAEAATGNCRLATASGNATLGAVDGRCRAQTASGDLHIGSADGVDARCVSGDLVIGRLTGDASLVNVSGTTRVLRCERGRVRARSVSGEVIIGLPEGLRLRVDADSMSGRVRSEIPIAEGPPHDPGPPDVSLAVRSVSGDVSVERSEEPARTG